MSHPISGSLLLLFGAALLKVALDNSDAPSNPMWILCAAWGVGLVAVILVCQGTVLILTGQWLLEILYMKVI